MLDDTAAARTYSNSGRLLVFKLNDGKVLLPKKIAAEPTMVKEFDLDVAANLKQGEQLYIRYCGACHGMFGSKSFSD